MSKAVVGLGFGDEGKGLTINYLTQEYQYYPALIVRYSGGQQAGHTVVKDSVRHVFSNFGSGTLNGNPTYWSKYCTVDPLGIVNELESLNIKMSNIPILYIDGKCPITTPLEKGFTNSDGTCGVGVGQTYQREENHDSLLFEDLFYPSILEMKLEILKKKYYFLSYTQRDFDIFNHCVNLITSNLGIRICYGIPHVSGNIIFESSQGLLLDQNYGFFPHVTRSNVGSTNILSYGDMPEMFLVTRAYQTRHGNGPMTNENISHLIKPNPLETNVLNKFQGKFRISLLDIDLLQYAITKDTYISKHRNNLVISCMDHLEDVPRYTIKGKIHECKNQEEFATDVAGLLKVSHLFISESDDSKLKQIY